MFARVLTFQEPGTFQKITLSIPSGRHRERIALSASGTTGVTATLSTGRRPTVVVGHLPAGTIRFEFITIGNARDIIRSTGCVRNRKRQRGSAAIGFADGTPTHRERFRVVSVCHVP